MRFVAIDVETANSDVSSICQIGIASYDEGRLVSEWKSYVNPEDYFDGVNVSIHGIDESTVQDSPSLAEIAPQIYLFLDGQVSVCHTHFDRVAVHQGFAKYQLRPPSCAWLDSARVARRTWEQFANRGYGLGNICRFLGYEFTAHDALEDAKAAAQIVNAAIGKTGLGVSDWLARVNRPIGLDQSGSIARDGDPDGPLFGEVLVFTGALQLPRREAAALAAKIGCAVDAGVTKKTTMLIVGDQDVLKFAGHEKSNKHRKAEALIAAGQPIRILRETDFEKLVSLVVTQPSPPEADLPVDGGLRDLIAKSARRDLGAKLFPHSPPVSQLEGRDELDQAAVSKMRVVNRPGFSGIEIRIGDEARERLVPVEGTPQTQPRRYYVYAHQRLDRVIFYIGRGTGRRAWKRESHELWRRYVATHLDGQYHVVILQDDLSSEEAEDLASEWAAQESATLVNWMNFGRTINLQRNAELHALRDANRELIGSTRALEATNPELALNRYLQAIDAAGAYADWDDENGLVGQLKREERLEKGRRGELAALDRLTICLLKLGRTQEAFDETRRYFERYRGDLELAGSEPILKRVEKALKKATT